MIRLPRRIEFPNGGCFFPLVRAVRVRSQQWHSPVNIAQTLCGVRLNLNQKLVSGSWVWPPRTHIACVFTSTGSLSSVPRSMNLTHDNWTESFENFDSICRAGRHGSHTGLHRGRRIILLTVFMKTQRQERKEIRRAKQAMERCASEGHTTDEE